MNQLQKISDCKPASFDGRSIIKMTEGQSALLVFLTEKVKSGTAITREDICDFYIEKVKKNEFYKVYGSKPHPNPIYTHMITDLDNFTYRKWREDWNFTTTAISWFKNNLGSCILKGKLLAIPAIELDK